MTGERSASFRRCAMLRARMSVDPPAANGTTMRMGFVGKASAAHAIAHDASKLAAKTIRNQKRAMPTSPCLTVTIVAYALNGTQCLRRAHRSILSDRDRAHSIRTAPVYHPGTA